MMEKLFSRFWLAVAGMTLSICWVLPNNSPPWLAFHKDAWIGVIFLLISAWVFWPRSSITFELHWWPMFAVCACLVISIQYAIGLIHFFGSAWIQCLYLLGFAMAFQVGLQWERISKHQCGDFVFTGFVIAAMVSTGIQIYQWLGLRTDTIWILNNNLPDRYYANISQPNLLGSLLLIGVIACSWGYFRKKLTGWLATTIAAFLLFGVVLTGSRTAWLNVLAILVAIVIFRKKLPHAKFAVVAVGLGALFFLLVWAFPFINELIYPEDGKLPIQYRGLQDGVRTTAWRMLLDASTYQPWLGFGWGQVAQANFSVMVNYPPVGAVFTHAHNLVLDMILWNGYPLGFLFLVVLVKLTFLTLRAVESFDQMCLLAVPLILGTHAMLEFPLQYAYFLLPLGMSLGAVVALSKITPPVRVSPWFIRTLAFVLAIAFSVTVRDYLRVEASFYGIRFEERGIPSSYPKTPPDVLVLTQMREAIVFARNTPKSGLTDLELQAMRSVVYTTPSTLAIYKLASNLAVNNRTSEAANWLLAMCMVSDARLCAVMKQRWLASVAIMPGYGQVDWPKGYSE